MYYEIDKRIQKVFNNEKIHFKIIKNTDYQERQKIRGHPNNKQQ
jgi:hypothetical protein